MRAAASEGLELNHVLPCPSSHRQGIVLDAKEAAGTSRGRSEARWVQKCRQGGIGVSELGRGRRKSSKREKLSPEKQKKENKRWRKGAGVCSEQVEIHLLSCITVFLMF